MCTTHVVAHNIGLQQSCWHYVQDDTRKPVLHSSFLPTRPCNTLLRVDSLACLCVVQMQRNGGGICCWLMAQVWQNVCLEIRQLSMLSCSSCTCSYAQYQPSFSMPEANEAWRHALILRALNNFQVLLQRVRAEDAFLQSHKRPGPKWNGSGTC